MSPDPRYLDSWRAGVHGVLHTLVVPQGYTLTVAGTLALAVGHRGFPGILGIWAFVLGAGLAFCAAALFSGAVAAEEVVRPSIAGAALLNLVPAVAVPPAVSASWWIPDRDLSFLIAGCTAPTLYVLGVAGLFSVVTRIERRGAGAEPVEPGKSGTADSISI